MHLHEFCSIDIHAKWYEKMQEISASSLQRAKMVSMWLIFCIKSAQKKKKTYLTKFLLPESDKMIVFTILTDLVSVQKSLLFH